MPLPNFSQIPKHKQLTAAPAAPSGKHHPVVIVGGGPVGLTIALDLGQRGHQVVLLNQFDFIPGGSKAICFAKRTLDIWNRLGIVKRLIDKGVIWNVGKVFRGSRKDPIYEFDLVDAQQQQMPAFINLQQYYVEEYLLDAISELPNIDLRFGHRVANLDKEQNLLSVETKSGSYSLSADWILACDGSKSAIRELLKLDFDGRVFEDNFLIADVTFEQERPAERWFWFDPPWGGASALLHKQPDDIWRLDFQLGWDIDRGAATQPENVSPYVEGMIGKNTAYKEEWYSVYTFQCRRMSRFVHGNIIFLGDSAHLVSPFGARGCNGGIADAENLGWKLDAVLKSKGSQDLIETYNTESIITADENILNSSRSTDFMTPKTGISQAFRDAVLDLSESYEFARPFVNSGRLSTAVHYSTKTSLSLPDRDTWTGGIAPGSPAIDAPIKDGWLLEHLAGQWTLLTSTPIENAPLPSILLEDQLSLERYDLQDGGVYLIRPDQYVSARWKKFSLSDLEKTAWQN